MALFGFPSGARDAQINGARERAETDTRGMPDAPFLALTVLLVVIGVIMMFSASYADAYHDRNTNYSSAYYFTRQGIYALIGLGVMMLASRVSFRLIRRFTTLFLLISVIFLIVVFFFGSDSHGAKRWVNLGIRFQPSELAKLAIILFYANVISRHPRCVVDFKREFMYLIGALILICLLLIMEPHISATIIIVLLAAAMLLLGGMDFKWFAFAGVLVVVGIALVILARGYASQRITAWLNPEADAADSGYQIMQSLYAIGSGGLMGLGFGKSRQKYLYLPEGHNDYVFAIVCEELGLVGALVVLLLFALLIVRGYWIALHAKDRYRAMVAGGITTLTALQVLFNIAVVTNTIPATGISLPFFSYGGTALILQLAEMGLVLNVSRTAGNKIV